MLWLAHHAAYTTFTMDDSLESPLQVGHSPVEYLNPSNPHATLNTASPSFDGGPVDGATMDEDPAR